MGVRLAILCGFSIISGLAAKHGKCGLAPIISGLTLIWVFQLAFLQSKAIEATELQLNA
jgi:hypothetical protein